MTQSNHANDPIAMAIHGAPIIKTPLFLITQRRDTVHVGNFFRINHSALDPIQHRRKALDLCGIGSHGKKRGAKRQCHAHLMESSRHHTLGFPQLLKVVNSLGITISVAAVAIGQDP